MNSVLEYDFVKHIIDSIDEDTISFWDDDDVMYTHIRDFEQQLRTLDAVPRFNNDEAISPQKKVTENCRFYDQDWVCPTCACKVGDYNSSRNYTQAYCDYCPDCGKRMNWPAVSDHILRTHAYYSVSDITDLLNEMGQSNDQTLQKLSDYLMDQLLPHKITFLSSFDFALTPRLQMVESPMFVDYFDESNNLKGEYRIQKTEEYQCPVCSYFVDSHEFPFLYTLGVNCRET